MAKLDIGGHQVEVDDSFLKLSPDQQNATVEEISKSLGPSPAAAAPPPQSGGYMDTALDVGKSLASGVARGAADLVGFPGTVGDLGQRGVNYLMGYPAPAPSPFSGESIRSGVSAVSGGASEYKPQTTPGKYAGTVGEFIPGAVAMGGSDAIIANVLKFAAVPGIASEGAGQVAQKYAPGMDPYARIAAALLAPAGVSAVEAALPSAARASTGALDELSKAATADGLTPQMMQQRLADLGPQGKIGDLGPNLQGQTGALANLPGENNQIVRTALNDRQAGANARLGQTIDQSLGPRVIPSQVDQGIVDSQAAVAQQYGPVMANARAVDTQPLADHLDAAVANVRGPEQQAIQRVRGYLNIPGTDVLDPNPQALLATRQAIDGLLQNEQNGQVIRQLAMARQQVDQTLAASAPGIKDVDAQFAELARQRQALGEGQSMLDSGRTAPRPEDVAQRVQGGALPQGTQVGPSAVPLRLSQGARADIDRIVGNKTNDIVAINQLIKGEGDWNRAKLVSLFGQDRTDQLIRVLDNERQFAETRNFATGNSLSANRLQYQKDLTPGSGGMTVKDYYGAGGLMGAARGLGLKGFEKVAGKVVERNANARNAALADILTTPQRDAVVQALIARQTQPNRLVDPGYAAVVEALIGRSTSGKD